MHETPEQIPEQIPEQELRALLERAVPQLPAPAERLERVRARALRRRRRRTAGVSATVVVAVALAGLLVPGLTGRNADRVPDAGRSLAPPASGSTGPATGSAAPKDSRTSAPPTSLGNARPFHFSELAGFRMTLPSDWSTLTAPKTGVVYVASQSLGLPPNGCVMPLDGFCTPLARTLSPGGALMMLTLSHNQGMADKLRLHPPSVDTAALLKSCRTVGGTTQLSTAIVDSAGSDVVIAALVCLARPTAARQAQVQDALTTADFS